MLWNCKLLFRHLNHNCRRRDPPGRLFDRRCQPFAKRVFHQLRGPATVQLLHQPLAVLPDLGNVQLQSSALSKVGTQEIVQFTILADIAPGATS